ncbi:DUF3631 domain-containing protein [Caballeronia sp. BCC1704]|uniref:DUF3631 domain-containing protein n=1 Tax=Caballeronia sp. BCC1704 TaxID=2676300 RepID=UPI00158B9E9F|nr:DUF3631 domain-containing protein [Caballeronia sp. BCC1704]
MHAVTKIETEFAQALAEAGFPPVDIVADSKLHRIDGPEDKRGKKSGWYILHADNGGAGGFGCHKSGIDKRWSGSAAAKLSGAELDAHRARMAEVRGLADAERARVRAEAATAARELWHGARWATADNPYCTRKGVKPIGLKEFQDKRTLVVPISNSDGEIVNVQFIYADGTKRFKTGGAVTGCSYQFGGEPREDGVLLIGEGFATCATAYAATGNPVVVAFNAGNLLTVARAWRARLPAARIVLLADDDYATEGNPGLTKAREAAQAVGGVLAVPEFGASRPTGATDLNDLQAHAGIEAVRTTIERALAISSTSKESGATCATLAEPTGAEVRMFPLAVTTPPPPDAETDEQTIARLAALKPLQYDRVRKVEAKRMGVQVTTLDKLVAAERSDEEDEGGMFLDVEPHPDPVDGAELVDALRKTIRRFIVCNEATARAAVLWIVMTWLMESVDVAPIAAITAPEKRCGKSQLLFLIGRLACRPLAASNITAAALFRAVETWKPTLLLDEADAFMRENEELRGLLNCGHTRDSAYVIRTVGDDHTPKRFFVWGAKAIAGIGHLADTLMDRSIVLELRRKLPHEQVDKLRHAEPGLFADLCARLARWSEDNADAVRQARPELPEALHDRAADNWEPLLQIAEVIGGSWPELARNAALTLSGEAQSAQSAGVELLTDIKTVFETQSVTRISMADLLAALLADDEAPWKTWNRGREMTLRQLGKKLSEFGIKSKAVRIGYNSPKGFEFDQFKDAFARYLSPPPVSPSPSVTRSQPNAGAGLSVTDAQSRDRMQNPSVTLEPLPHKGCDRVTEETAVTENDGKDVTDDSSEDNV